MSKNCKGNSNNISTKNNNNNNYYYYNKNNNLLASLVFIGIDFSSRCDKLPRRGTRVTHEFYVHKSIGPMATTEERVCLG